MQKREKYYYYIAFVLLLSLVLFLLRLFIYYEPAFDHKENRLYNETHGYIVNYKDVRLITYPDSLMEVTNTKSFREMIEKGCQRCGLLSKLPLCKKSDPVGTECKLNVLDIRPTQFCIGPAEAFGEMRKGSAYTRYGLLEDHLTEEFNHVIIHQNKFYITDGHHFLHGISKLAIPDEIKYVPIIVDENRGNEPTDDFWEYMINYDLCWLKDNLGNSFMNPSLLPSSFPDMLSDPYRDISYVLKMNGGYKKSFVPFAELIWADFLRAHIPSPPVVAGPDDKFWCTVRPFDIKCIGAEFDRQQWVIQKARDAKELARSSLASHLPGYIPPK